MASSPDLDFQTACFTELAAELAGVTVLAHPGHEQPLPYVFLGESEVADNNPNGHEVIVHVHSWSKLEGPHQLKQIQHTIREALHNNSISQGDWRFSCIREDFAKSFLDEDNETWHGVQRFRAYAGLI